MPITSEEMAQAITKAFTDMERLEGVVNGTDTQSVETDNGPVPSVAKFFKDQSDAINATGTGLLAQTTAAKDAAETARTGAEAAQTGAEAARDEAQAIAAGIDLPPIGAPYDSIRVNAAGANWETYDTRAPVTPATTGQLGGDADIDLKAGTYTIDNSGGDFWVNHPFSINNVRPRADWLGFNLTIQQASSLTVRLVPTAATANKYMDVIDTPLAVASNQQFFASVVARADGYNFLRLWLVKNVSEAAWGIVVDLSTGTLISDGGLVGLKINIIDVGDSYYRITLRVPEGEAANWEVRYYVHATADLAAYSGDGVKGILIRESIVQTHGNSRAGILEVKRRLYSANRVQQIWHDMGQTFQRFGTGAPIEWSSWDAIGGYTFATWTSERRQQLVDRSKRECHILDFTGPSDSNDNTPAILRWAAQGQAAGVKLVLGADGSATQADFLLSEEIEITKNGQIVEFDQWGGFAYGDGDPRVNWQRGTRLRGVGTWFGSTGKRVRTRRLFRGSASDPQDATLSAMLNIQAEGVTLIRPALWLDCNYSDVSPSNLGVNCDVGIFSGTRVGLKIVQPQIIGYFRRAGIYLDVSQPTGAPRHLSKAGTPYPSGTVLNGMDGWRIDDPYLLGGRVGLAVLGARPKTGATDYGDQYYDQQVGGLITDNRGSFGASDGLVTGGRIFGPEHHSNRRLADPTPSGGVLNATSLAAEPDTMPAALYIDGLAGNASSNIWGMRFIGTRIASFEAFRTRLRKASRVSFIGAHMEGRNSGGRRNTAGTVIDTNDYTLHSYGDVAGEAITDRVTAFGHVRQSFTDGFAPHFYGATPLLITDSGRIFSGGVYDATTAQTSSAVVLFPDGQMRRSTSAAKYKANVRSIPDQLLERLLELDGVLYDSAIEGEEHVVDRIGVIADQADELGLDALVAYGRDGEVENFDYARMTALLLEIVKRQEARLRAAGL